MQLKKIFSLLSANNLSALKLFESQEMIVFPKDGKIKFIHITNELFCKETIDNFFKNNEIIKFLPKEIVKNNIYIPKKISNLTFPQYFSTLAQIKKNFLNLIFLKFKNFIPTYIVNFIYNKFTFNTFWEAILFEEIGILINADKNIKRCKPIGSSILEKATGSIICHLYYHNNLIICPLYQGSLNQNNGLVIFCKSTNTFYFILTKVLKNKFTEDIKIMKCFGQSIINSANKANIKKTKKLIYVGGKINYGHTIINDSAYLKYLFSDRYENLNFILGNYDFLSTLELYKKVKLGSKTKKNNFHLLNDYYFSNSIFSVPNYFVLPLPCYRPSEMSINLISYPLKERKYKRKYNAFYFLLDERKSHRTLRNIIEVLDTICKELKAKKINNIILDGMTSVPNYGKNQTSIVNSLSKEFLKKAIEKVKENNMQFNIIDGLSIIEKNKLCAKFNIKSGFASYGAGMAYPIYILNIPIAIGGTDAVISKKTLKRWRWHFSKYCHPNRNEKEFLIPSKNFSNKGYNLNIQQLKKYLTNNLEKNSSNYILK